MASDSLLVAAIDFGTTYSGWAFSFKHEFDRDPTKVSAKTWSGGQLVSLKGPTCALIKPGGRELLTFGFEAESKYAELAGDEKHNNWYFFRRFKMRLWNQGIHRDTMLEDEGGKKLPAKTVFALSIKFLKDDLLKMSENRVTGCALKAGDIHWVLTVPAIWNDAAKQFMREAAQDAGISSDKLTIALEPEAASLYCRHLPVEKSGAGKYSLSKFSSGKRYLVLDAGGGTVDITVHEVSSGGKLKELHKASGGAWGGTKVDDAFLDFLASLAGSGIVTKFKEDCMEDYIDLLRDFEVKKREISPSKDGKITLRVPIAFSDVVREVKGQGLKELIQGSRQSDKVKLTGDKLRIDADVARKLFEPTVNSIVTHVSDLLRESVNRGIEAIVMVGGFSESPMLQETIRKRFSSLKVIVPDEAGLAVLKGAVIYGHSPQTIAERVSKYTYGTDISVPFDDDIHPSAKRQTYKDGSVRCNDVFSTLVESGQALVVGQAQQEKGFSTVFEDQTAMPMNIYASRDKSPKYTTDYGCQRIGTFEIPLSGYGVGRSVKVKMIFGGTEIDVECTEEATGRVSNLTVDFLA